MVRVLRAVVIEAAVPDGSQLAGVESDDCVRIPHSERVKHPGLHCILVRSTVHFLQKETQGLVPDVGVAEVFPWRGTCPAVPQGPGLVETVGANIVAAAQARCMRHQVVGCDRLVIRLHLEPREVAGYGGVQVKAAFIVQLHQGDIGERLADRPDFEHQAGMDRGASRQVGITEG